MKIYLDVSEWQCEIDWDKVSGIDGVMVRAGVGTRQDKFWLRNISELNRLGIPAGVYWFSYAKDAEEAAAEAEACLAAIADWRIELPVAFDFEYESRDKLESAGVTPGKENVSAIVRGFCEAVEGAGYYTMVYSNRDFSGRYFEDDILRKYDLWLADWKALSETAQPGMSCGLWQYGKERRVGFGPDVDCNVALRDYPAIIRKAELNNLVEKTDPVVDFAYSLGLTADGSDKAEAATKYDLWRALYLQNK